MLHLLMPAIFLMLCVGLPSSGDDEAPPSVDAPRRLADWIGVDPPGDNGPAYQMAQGDSRSWDVALAEGQPVAVPVVETHAIGVQQAIGIQPPFAAGLAARGDDLFTGGKTRRIAARVADGWVVGLNHGEFGGSAWWLDPTGTERYRITDTINPAAFVATDQGLLMLEGLAHLSTDRGRILRLARDARGRWIGEPFVDVLGSAPRAATLTDPTTLLVVGFDSLLRIDLPTRRVDLLVDDAFWGGLYPTSVVVDPAGAVWIGMRRGVARLDAARRDPAIRWYLPNRAVADEKPIEGFR